jgi:hypothetical protein
MHQASRIAILGLWALMQVFAPLVHAHAGGGPLPGMLHIPGLEFLAKPQQAAAQPSLEPGDPADFIVGPALGLKSVIGHLVPAPDPQVLLPLCHGPKAAAPGVPLDGLAPLAFLVFPACWLRPGCRAPPAWR